MNTIEVITSITNISEGLTAEVVQYIPTGFYGVAITDTDAGQTLPEIQFRHNNLHAALVEAHQAILLDNPVGLTAEALNRFVAYCDYVNAPNPPKRDEVWGRIHSIAPDLTSYVSFKSGLGLEATFTFDCEDYIYA